MSRPRLLGFRLAGLGRRNGENSRGFAGDFRELRQGCQSLGAVPSRKKSARWTARTAKGPLAWLCAGGSACGSFTAGWCAAGEVARSPRIRPFVPASVGEDSVQTLAQSARAGAMRLSLLLAIVLSVQSTGKRSRSTTLALSAWLRLRFQLRPGPRETVRVEDASELPAATRSRLGPDATGVKEGPQPSPGSITSTIDVQVMGRAECSGTLQDGELRSVHEP